MERGKRIQAINGEIPLPEAIIQHIQSFLDGKQAAKTSVLSKSWYNAWLTRPNVDLDERHFPIIDSKSLIPDEFLIFAKKTMERYRNFNLKIESFRLWLRSTRPGPIALAYELILGALKMDVSCIDLEFDPPNMNFVLPDQVLEFQNLIRLSVSGCKIDPPVGGKVNCLRLKSLTLSTVRIGDDLVWDIISSCPLIENLVLSICESVVEVTKLISARRVTKMLTLKTPSIEFDKRNVGSVVDAPIKVSEFYKLKRLLLERVTIDNFFFRDFSHKFPCLEDLSIQYCYGYKGIQISSRSIKCISMGQTRMLRGKFDVPNIRKFSFSGSTIPSLSFTTASSDWESDISISCSRYHLGVPWFLELKKFLTKLSQSKISLNLWFLLEKRIDCMGDNQGLHMPTVENLILSMNSLSAVCSALLDGLFWSFRPKVVTLSWFPRSLNEPNNNLIELLCKKLIQQESGSSCSQNLSVLDLRGLEEVNVEIREDSRSEWRPLPWKALLDASTSPEKKKKVRFLLKWVAST
ncbi:putative F-box/LRR-repeat protein [Sesamum alatum]|uniref:F-box/LRR-repeat protein n=1 Tax=Sesamum alatum TaxID=300844 RepID=A0AAE2CKS3_9LAMI|nr:putative F-box/LRR-repeat protein [Sesamum alatum]